MVYTLIVRQSIHDTARNGARFLMWHLRVQVAHCKPLQHATMCVYKLWMDAKEDLEVENIVEGRSVVVVILSESRPREKRERLTENHMHSGHICARTFILWRCCCYIDFSKAQTT